MQSEGIEALLPTLPFTVAAGANGEAGVQVKLLATAGGTEWKEAWWSAAAVSACIVRELKEQAEVYLSRTDHRTFGQMTKALHGDCTPSRVTLKRFGVGSWVGYSLVVSLFGGVDFCVDVTTSTLLSPSSQQEY